MWQVMRPRTVHSKWRPLTQSRLAEFAANQRPVPHLDPPSPARLLVSEAEHRTWPAENHAAPIHGARSLLLLEALQNRRISTVFAARNVLCWIWVFAGGSKCASRLFVFP